MNEFSTISPRANFKREMLQERLWELGVGMEIGTELGRERGSRLDLLASVT